MVTPAPPMSRGGICGSDRSSNAFDVLADAFADTLSATVMGT
jgi:hypothetical protein